jgi:Endonuclease NucS
MLMALAWQEHFFEKLVAAAHAVSDERLATATLHRRKKTASFQHPQLRHVECSFGNRRTSGSQAQMLLIACQPKRGTEIDAPVLKRQMYEAGIGGDMQVDHDALFFQYQWGFGHDTAFPVHDARRIGELTRWTTGTLALLFNHMEQRRHIITPTGRVDNAHASLDLRVALEQYLEDLLIQQWDALPWDIELEYVGRQVECGALGCIDILAQDRSSGDYVVIELKRHQGDDEVVGQCSRYMGWIKQYRADPTGVGVRGIIVAYDTTDRLPAAVLPHANIGVYTYQFSVALTPVVTELKAKG